MVMWLNSNEYDDVVVSTRLRVARNLERTTFPVFASEEESKEVLNKVRDAMDLIFKENEYSFHKLDDMEQRERSRYMEDHLISPGLVEKSSNGSFFLRNDEKVTIMINEEDHIRLQVLLPGFDIIQGWELCSQIDDMLESKLDFAYHREYGYLTTCPTNTGTGLRASVMLHLPGVTATGNISSIINALKKAGLTIRGIYGEGTEAVGDLYQVSNQLTLGETEDEIIEKLNRVVCQLIKREKSTRAFLLEKRHVEFEDRVFRAKGLLSNARVISSKEALKNLSTIKLGIDSGILADLKGKELIDLMISIRPGNVQSIEDKVMNKVERDVKRATVLREYFN
ncbi:MAG: protein arginine kinase [Gudongella sp.]|nr:protein arginine kinase [Gudongella sp.]